MSYNELIIEGAKQNNLKNITLRLPHDKVIVITGVSGSGKSSLAFDTVFAEGQWRFVESLSTYARLFLEKLDRPAVDAIENIRPAIALEQRNPVRGSRSTVGTSTEIYDYLRLLYAKAAELYCPKCGGPVRKWSASEITAELVKTLSDERAFIIFESRQPGAALARAGFHRVMLDGKAIPLEEVPAGVEEGKKSPWEVVLDRLVIKDEPRLSDSVETAFRHGEGRMKVSLPDGRVFNFSSGNVCDSCGTEYPEPTPLLFSFNHPLGACPSCKGFGNVLKYSEDLIVPDPHLSVAEGAIEPWQKPSYKWWFRQLMKGARGGGFPINKPWNELGPAEKAVFFKGSKDFYGINDFFEELEGKRYKLHVRVFLSRYRRALTCPSCKGKRLKPEALAYKMRGRDIGELTRLSITALEGFINELRLPDEKAAMVKEPLRQINLKLEFLIRVGLDYLSTDREARTLSGGEYQRVSLSNQLASRLTGTLYVLDEPTVGLHPRDVGRIADIMGELSALGNTLLVVEHDKTIIGSADWIVELGPGGGHLGGEVVFSGPKEDFLLLEGQNETATSRYLKGTDRIEAPRLGRRKPSGWLRLQGAKGNNLNNLNVNFPLGAFSVVTGVSGSGKSSLVVETLYRGLVREMRIEPEEPLPYCSIQGIDAVKGVKLIDQAPIGRSPRSNPVTYLKVFDHIRKLFSEQLEARAHGYGPGFFSFNVPGGRCPTCKGEGFQKLEMYFFEDLYIKCEDCAGKRYTRAALGVYYKGKDIAEVLGMTVDEAAEFFSAEPRIEEKLRQMQQIGLGYLRLGQPATTLSGGEAQRLKICAEMGTSERPGAGLLYVLDEPTVGLHYRDIVLLLRMLQALVDRGNTVLVIEHNPDVVYSSDWVIDLGPEGGIKGGKILFEGTPEGLLKSKGSYTAEYLRMHLEAREQVFVSGATHRA